MLLLLFECVFADTTLSSLAGGSIVNTQYSQTSTCLCDLTLGFCDIYCCCDAQCPSTQTQLWDLQQKCSDNYYAGLYSIPQCNLQTQKSFLDLYSGLRIAYNLIKRLGCLYSFSILTDTVKQSIFKNFDQLSTNTPLMNSLIQYQKAQSTDRITYMTQVTASYSTSLYLSNSQYIVQAVKGSPYCRKKLVRNYTNYYSQTCYYNGQSSTADLLNATSVRNYDINDNVNQVYSVTNSNVTYLIGKIYYASLPTNTTSTQQQTISSDQFANQQSQSINTFFSGLFFNGSGVYQATGRNGYDRKSLIRFLKTQNNEIPLPLRLPIVNSDGSCSNISTQPSLLNEIYIQFLVNQQITCNGNTNFGDAFSNQVQYVAKYADSDPNQVAGEWIQVSNNSTGQYVELDFYISGYGKQGQEKYQINNVLLQISQLTTQLDSYSHINIRFLDASLPFNEYKAPGPQVINNIPNKIIAPFA
ncbi:hypothetical protein pb186bvf_017518 [Paramecium bursaria]